MEQHSRRKKWSVSNIQVLVAGECCKNAQIDVISVFYWFWKINLKLKLNYCIKMIWIFILIVEMDDRIRWEVRLRLHHALLEDSLLKDWDGHDYCAKVHRSGLGITLNHMYSNDKIIPIYCQSQYMYTLQLFILDRKEGESEWDWYRENQKALQVFTLQWMVRKFKSILQLKYCRADNI